MNNTGRSRFLNGTNELSIYSDAEAEWLRALLRWKQKTGCQLPTAAELLGLLERLGYRRAEGPLPPAALEERLCAYRHQTGKRFPTYTESLSLLADLGYVKSAPLSAA